MQHDELKTKLLESIQSALPSSPDGSSPEITLEIPPEMKMGDFAFPCFKLAKALRSAPPKIASEIFTKLQTNEFVSKYFEAKVLGPYINFTIKKEILLGELLSSLLLSKNEIASVKTKNPKTVILEFSSPNVAKAFNIYHLRSTMIGNCLYRIFKARGYNPISFNHLGDWGTQYGTLSLAYQMWGNEKELDQRGIEYLVELYVRINKEIETNPELENKARENFSKLEKGDAQITALWKKFVDLSINEFSSTYSRLGVHFDHIKGESFYVPFIPKLEKMLSDKKLLKESEGAMVVDLGEEMPPCIVRKQDGSSIYATRDLAAAIYRHEQFNFAKMIYIVGGEQRLHFSQVFKTLEKAGFEWAKECVHIDFGLYRFVNEKGEAQKMSTRKGNFVTLEHVLDEAVEKVEKIMADKVASQSEETSSHLKLSAAEQKEASEIIGTGAIVYNDLSTDRNHDVNFDIEKVCDFNGETGPYIQYAHTRCLSILRNAPAELISGIDTSKLLDLSFDQKGFASLFETAKKNLSEPEELDLIRTLMKLPGVLDTTLEHYKPSHLAGYMIDITKQFNQFYRAHKVLSENQDLTKARLALVLATQRVLLKSLELLGMRAPVKM